jgi:hypothetical protein
VEIEPAPLPLDDEALRALGVIAVQSARVEWQLAGLRSVVDKSRSHVEHLRSGRAVEHVRAIRRYLETNESWAGPDATSETALWAEQAGRLYERGNIMHSAWVIDGDTSLTRRNMRTGDDHPFDQAILDELGHRLGLHAATGYIYMFLAAPDLFNTDDAG